MTPKEKAKELVRKFRESGAMDDYAGDFESAKICALIAVEEILEVLWHTHKTETEYRYWQEVKQEIERL